MTNYEYKSIVLAFKAGIFKQGLPDIEGALNADGKQGWRLREILLPSSSWGSSDNVVAILERPSPG